VKKGEFITVPPTDLVDTFAKNEFHAEIMAGICISIFGKQHNVPGEPIEFGHRFNVGDRCVCGRYNLIYTGTILQINKYITVKDTGENVRLTPLQFIRLNWNYDAKAIADHNAAEMLCI